MGAQCLSVLTAARLIFRDGAEKIFSIGTDEMYKSELPLYASKIYDSYFERIAIK